MSHAEHAWPAQLWQPCFQECHRQSSGHMKNAGSISDIKGATKAWGNRPKKQEAEDMLLNKASFISEVADSIKLFTTLCYQTKPSKLYFYTQKLKLWCWAVLCLGGRDLFAWHWVNTAVSSWDKCRGDRYHHRQHQLSQGMSLLKPHFAQQMQKTV